MTSARSALPARNSDADDCRVPRASEEIRTREAKLDPEDIHALSYSQDDALDGIEDAAHRIFAYRLNPIPPAMVQLCALICACAGTVPMKLHASFSYNSCREALAFR